MENTEASARREPEQENRWGSEEDKWRGMRNVKMVSQWSASGALKWNKNLLFPSLLLPLIPPLLYLPVITLFPTFTNRHQTLSPTNLLLIAPVCLPSLLLRRPSFPLSPPLISSTLFVYHPTRRPRTTTPPLPVAPVSRKGSTGRI